MQFLTIRFQTYDTYFQKYERNKSLKKWQLRAVNNEIKV